MAAHHEHDHTHTNGHAHAAAEMAEAAKTFLGSLSAQQKAKTVYHWNDAERIFWYYPPTNRHGLPLRDMDEDQRKLAYALMSTGLTERSYQQASQIIDLETHLGELEREAGMKTFVRDPELYYWTVFGEPGSADPWGWRVEGHHVSLHFHIWGDRVISTTPFFFGSNPAEVRKGPRKGLRILRDREELGFELVNSLDSGQRSRAILDDKSPWDILSYNSSKVVFPREEGLPASQMSGTQREMLMLLITEYVSQVRGDVAQSKLSAIKENGIDGFHFAWAGPTRPGTGHYYRIHGDSFIVEFDNRQNGANHIHSVLRDVDNDFGLDVLREHLLLYHVI